jgi:Flp pilus assembly pilin Flp
MPNLRVFLRDEDAAVLTEYVLLAFFIAIVCFVAVQQIGNAVSTIYNNVANGI